MRSKKYTLSVTTQGPTYPPSELLNEKGDFVVIGLLNLKKENSKECYQKWGAAIIDQKSPLPAFGENVPYSIVKHIDLEALGPDADMQLYTLPIPLPCNNYPLIFAPEQNPQADQCSKPSYPLHKVPIPDMRSMDGLKVRKPIVLGDWIRAQGELHVVLNPQEKSASFHFTFKNLIPNSLYTVMALREHDLDPKATTRPGPLGIPNVFVTDASGSATYYAEMPDPFPKKSSTSHRIINVVVLWMSKQMSYGGAIGHHGLGGDIHAQLKLQGPSFLDLEV